MIKMQISANGFPQRQNADGTYDSVCPRCFYTVARGMTWPEMNEEEKAHICSEFDLKLANITKVAIRKNLQTE
jgi:hypothetical protein